MIDNQYERVKTNHVLNLQRIQNDVLKTIYELELIEYDRKKITKLKTEKNKNIRIRN